MLGRHAKPRALDPRGATRSGGWAPLRGWGEPGQICDEASKQPSLDSRQVGFEEFGTKDIQHEAPVGGLSMESDPFGSEEGDSSCIVAGEGQAAHRPRRTSESHASRAKDALRFVNKVDELFPQWFNPYIDDTYMGKQTPVAPNIWLRSSGVKTGGDTTKPYCVLLPIGRPRITWDIVWAICLAYELWLMPLDWAFMAEGSMPNHFVVLNRITLCYFLSDILLNFFTGYMDGDQEVLDHWKIAMNYLSLWFWLDLFATVPWNDLFGLGAGMQGTRAAKISKALKVIKILKLVRVVKVTMHVKNAKRMKSQRELEQVMKTPKHTRDKMDLEKYFNMLKYVAYPAQALGLLLALAHVHSPLYASLRGWTDAEDIDVGFRRYYESIWWTFSLLAFGNPPGATNPHMWTLQILVLAERIFLVTEALSHLVFTALIMKESDAGSALRYADAMEYLKDHKVSIRTQVQVKFNVGQTEKIQKKRRHFLELLEQDLPWDLQVRIREELWSSHLLSLGLIWRVASWAPTFMSDLAQLAVEETYAAKVIIFKEGDSATSAFLILSGVVAVEANQQLSRIPDFYAGMWIGEKALVNLGLRRSATASTESVTTLLSVFASGFHGLLERFGVREQFNQFCSEELWKGLCGRCGVLGDHFAHMCPHTHMAEASQSKAINNLPSKVTRRITNTLTPATSSGCSEDYGAASPGSVARHHARLARDLKMFLTAHQLEFLQPYCERLRIHNLDDFEKPHVLDALLKEAQDAIDGVQALSLTLEMVSDFKAAMAERAKVLLSVKLASNHYFMFLSHYKIEAGTEAALMRTELEQLLAEDIGHPAQDLDTPIFLDSEDLNDLVQLMKAVCTSHNLVLMLTKNVLTRPWCVVEIATAVAQGVPVLPVLITKPGCEFKFPDDAFYEDMLQGKVLGPEGTQEVEKHGFSMQTVCEAIQRVAQRIALPYSPHRTAAIRRAEGQALLRQCSIRKNMHASESEVEPLSMHSGI